MIYRGIEVEQSRHVGLRFRRDMVQTAPGHHEMSGAGAVIPLFERGRIDHGIGHPVMDLAVALPAKQ